MLDQLDLSQRLSRSEYHALMKPMENQLGELHRKIHELGIPVIIVFEGWDAAGKGGNIRRLTKNLDPRGYEVVPIAAPKLYPSTVS